MDSDQAFHNLALSLRPKLPEKPSRYWVAILYHTKKPEDVKGENDFMWVKCHGRITIKTIKKSYVERHAMNLILKFGDTDQQPTEETPLSSLNKYKDNLVVVRAVEVSAASEHDLSAASLIQPSSSAPLGQEPFGHNTPATNGMKQINRHERAHQALNVMEESGDDPQAHIDDSGDAEELNDRKYQLPSPAVKKERSLSPKFEPAVSRQPSQASDSDMNDPQDSSGNVGKERHMSLQQLMKSPLPETLERGVQEAVQLLEKLKLALRKQSAEKNIADADNWTTSITNLQEQAVRTRTVVGVVGNTGAGKSSVINAMLDEERLVPTNCMRACTAVVTELSWNDDDDENKKYRAAIEFIKPEDWERELKVLFNDLLDQNGQVSRDCANPDSDAGVAYAKIKAVYPQMTKEDIARSSVAKLMKFPIVAEVLGTTIKIEKAEPEGFYRKLQTYVDSKEKIIKKDKGTGTGKDKEKKEPRKTEYWPLIKVVRIFVRSPALATGAVIVDLPGVQDSNAARAAVAAGYMKQCTGLWIVAPITRAVDDKSAKNLLGDTFKRQLKYDGTYSAVTFICSKTDDISITEATDSLGLEDRMSELFSQEDSIEQTIKELEKRLVALKDEKEVFSEMFDDQDELLAVWERLSNKLGDGEKVFRPLQKKRKSNLATDKPRKRRASSDDDFLADTDSDRSNLSGSDSEKEDETEDQEEERQPLTEEDIATEINQIRVFKKKARSSKAELEDKIRQVRKEITAAKFEHNEVQAKMNTICISGRNDYSRRAIQFDFAAGVEELDQENAIEEDEENFNPDDEKRDYEQVARDLPVFCVSSRAYQKLSGRLKKDSAVPGFTTLDQTEIPALQAHCKKLTEAGRSSSCRRFLNNLNQLLTSISLWASDDGSGATLTDQQKVREVLFLKKKLAELEKALEEAVSTCVKEINKALIENIYDKYEKATDIAIEASVGTAAKWGAHRAEGGLYWATYKATVRRSGMYNGAAGARDFNAELCEPMIVYLASGWEKTFQRHLPRVLEAYKKDAGRQLQCFHDAIGARAHEKGLGLSRIELLARQIGNHQALLQDHTQKVLAAINERQREVNREFTPVITAAMEVAYTICTNECGTGSYARMKAAMLNHVEKARSNMFMDAVKGVEERLAQMCRDVEEFCANQSDYVWRSMQQDYMGIIAGVQVDSAAQVSSAERKIRRRVKDLLDNFNEAFDRILCGGQQPETEVAGEDLTTQLGDDGQVSQDAADPTQSIKYETADHEDAPDDFNDVDEIVPATDMDDVNDYQANPMLAEWLNGSF